MFTNNGHNGTSAREKIAAVHDAKKHQKYRYLRGGSFRAFVGRFRDDNH